MRRLALLPLSLLLISSAPFAAEPAQGTFQASQACEAFQSFRKGTNPGQVKLVPGTRYAIREINGQSRQWYRIEVPGAGEPLRWVSADCGSAEGAGSPTAAPAPAKQSTQACNVAGQQDSYVLAITWQPGFCEHSQFKGRKPECEHLADGSLKTPNLTLHGLWPNRQSCGAHYGNCSDAPLQLSQDTLEFVRPWMPNFYYETRFGSHEWEKHGTCQALDDDAYFREAATAVRTVNDSEIGRYITANAGKTISRQEFYRKVEAAAGNDKADNNFTLLCEGSYLNEIRVRLPREFKAGGSVAELIGTPLPKRPAPSSKECRQEQIRIEAGGV